MKIVKKIMKWLGIGIGALLVLTILASLVMNVIFGRELRQTMAKLKAEGRALTIAEIRPAPVPDDRTRPRSFRKPARCSALTWRIDHQFHQLPRRSKSYPT